MDMSPSPVFLVGYRGSGKSSVGRALADRLGWIYLDCDRAIEEEAGTGIAVIFETRGEAAFRELEERVLESVVARLAASKDGAVIGTGGGVVLRDTNVRRMRALGKVVWLTASATALRERIRADARSAEDRPALLGVSAADEIEAVLRVREPRYRAAADFSVDTEGRPPVEIAREIAERLALESR